MTVDPKYVHQARVIEKLHYREAAELAYFGAKVLHPQSLVPLASVNIPLKIKNSFHPNEVGTTVNNEVDSKKYPVKALTAITKQALISVEGHGIIGVPGIAARTFSALANAGVSVSFISQSSSEASICFVVSENEKAKSVATLQEAFHWELEHNMIDRIEEQTEIAIVAVVGLGMVGTPGIAARTFKALTKSKVNIIAIAQGSSELNISFAISDTEVSTALTALHQEYKLNKSKALSQRRGKKIELQLLGLGQIGTTLAKQIQEQESYFEKKLELQLSTIAVADKSGMMISEEGLSANAINRAIDRKAKHGTLFQKEDTQADIWPYSEAKEHLFQLPFEKGVVADLTATDTTEYLIEAMHQDFHVVLANKKTIGGTQKNFLLPKELL